MARQKSDAEESPAFTFRAMTDRQQDAAELWRRSRVLFLVGPAGTGKTVTALSLAVRESLHPRANHKRIMLSRPLVPTDEEMGFLPGTQDEKLGPWLAPFRDVAQSTVTGCKDQWAGLTKLLKDKECGFELVPTGMLRGRTVSYGTLILDEAQNCTRGQLVCALTRMGTGGRVVICGDPQQPDRLNPPPLLEVMRQVGNLDTVGVVRFDKSDCVRDPLVIEMIDALCGGAA